MKDLDHVFMYPDDEKISEINKAANNLYSHFVRQTAQQNQVQVPGSYVQPQQQQQQQQQQQVQAQVAPGQTVLSNAEVIPIQLKEPLQQAQLIQQPQQQVQLIQQPKQQIQQLPQKQSEQINPVEQCTAMPQHLFNHLTGGVQPDQVGAPTDRPSCFGGKAPRTDGGMGHDETEACLTCKYEFPCIDSCLVSNV